MRQLARLAGVSNPYLSQIERGLRRPSAEILQQIAKGLRISAEALYVQAGILDERFSDGVVVDAVLADTTLTERQKQVMLEVYDSFRKENLRRDADAAAAAASLVSDRTQPGTSVDLHHDEGAGAGPPAAPPLAGTIRGPADQAGPAAHGGPAGQASRPLRSTMSRPTRQRRP